MLQALAERVDSLRASAACATVGTSDPDAGTDVSVSMSMDDGCVARFDPDITVTNDDERGLTAWP